MPTLTAEERTTYTGYLADARKALHELTLGGQARVFVDQNGERVEFTATNTTKVRNYILELEVKLGLNKGLGPMRAGML